MNYGPAIDAGDTAWMLVCAALVFLMTPAWAIFSNGSVRSKSVTAVFLPCFTVISVVSLQWILFGYSLAFGPDRHGAIGSWVWSHLRYVGTDPNTDYSLTVPHIAFMMNQAMVAVFAATLALGSAGQRMKFSVLCLFTFCWTTCVYDPIAHWVWGAGGFLRSAGVSDSGGGVVVFLNAAIASGIATRFLRKASYELPPENEISEWAAVLSGGCLWVVWFALAAGSAPAAHGLSSYAFVSTQIAAVSAGFTWILLENFLLGRPTALGFVTGVISGLVASTPANGSVSAWGALAIGLGASLIGYFLARSAKRRGKTAAQDGVKIYYGVLGFWGMIATGWWASQAVNPQGVEGLWRGHPMQLLIQLKGVFAPLIYSVLVSYLLLKILDLTVGLWSSGSIEA